MPNRIAIAIASEDMMSTLMMHRCVHIVLTLVLVWVSYIFLNDTDNFARAPDTYSVIMRLGTEVHWGEFTLLGVALGGFTSYTNSWIMRLFGAAVLAVYHILFAICFALGRFDIPAVGMFIGCGILGGCLAYSTAHVAQRFTRRLATTD